MATGREAAMAKTSQAQRIAVAKYDQKNTKKVTLKLNRATDTDLIELLEHTENMQGLLKEALREYMKRTEA